MAGQSSSHPTHFPSPPLASHRHHPLPATISFAYVLCSPLYISHPSSDGEAFACQGTFASLLPNAERKAGFSAGRGKGRTKGVRAKHKEKMAPLPGLMNEANGRSQWGELCSCSPGQSIREPRPASCAAAPRSGTAGSFKSPNK